jgi:hypothetical protein
MGHLGTEELIDIAEETKPESSAPHLETCASCRQQLDDLRRMMDAASSVTVPEPSPLFWDHLSARVRDAVRTEGDLRPAWWRPSTWPQFALPALTAALAVLLVGALLTPRVMAPIAPRVDVAPGLSNAPAPLLAPATPVDDPALDLVAELAEQMDWETAVEIEPVIHAGAVQDAFDGLTEAERREMRELLRELENSGS